MDGVADTEEAAKITQHAVVAAARKSRLGHVRGIGPGILREPEGQILGIMACTILDKLFFLSGEEPVQGTNLDVGLHIAMPGRQHGHCDLVGSIFLRWSSISGTCIQNTGIQVQYSLLRLRFSLDRPLPLLTHLLHPLSIAVINFLTKTSGDP